MSQEYLERLGLQSSATEEQIKNRTNELIRQLQKRLNSSSTSDRDEVERELSEVFRIRAALLSGKGGQKHQTSEDDVSSSKDLRISYDEFAEGLGVEEDRGSSTSYVGLLMDTSSSMSGTKLNDARIALKAFLGNLNDSQIMVGLAEFGHSTGVICDQTNELDRVREIIGELVPGGSTPLYESLYSARQEWESLFGDEFLFIIATDGHPDGPVERILALASELKAEGVRFITIGIGSDANTSFLKQLASTPDDYFSAKASIQLETIYREISNGLAGLD